MSTIGEVYNPLIQFAEADDERGKEALRDLGRVLFERHPHRCSSIEEGIEQAKQNLHYYCQYFSAETTQKVKDFYGLGRGFMTLGGEVIP